MMLNRRQSGRTTRPFSSPYLAGWLAAVLWCSALSWAAVPPVGPSDQPEAYFNGSSYLRLTTPLNLHQLVGISFRSCVGGELFSQRYESHTLQVTAVFEEVVAAFTTPGKGRRVVSIPTRPLDNKWHFVALRYDPTGPALALTVDGLSAVVANSTYNSEVLSGGGLQAAGAVLLVGSVFSGCMREGPQLEFRVEPAQAHNVLFGDCPLTTSECKDRKDVLTIPPTDHCYHEPCMRHGTCISRHDRYECHCTARYTGNNCEQDLGDPCQSSPCRNQAACVEDRFGDYSCLCPDKFYGKHCELTRSLDPQCASRPCRHNGSCSVPPGAEKYVCACQPGFTGANCEIDIDECALAGPNACDNGGVCVDAVNNYTCQCSGTGYTGARCEVNVNECSEDASVCGDGVCYDTYGGFVCACRPGYAGDRCQTKLSPCASSPCGPMGTCMETGTNGNAGWRCRCGGGWGGPRCTTPPAPCDQFLCPDHSICVMPGMTSVSGATTAKHVQCQCEPGYFGASGLSPNCSTLEQACSNGVCLNGGTCLRMGDHINCTCAPQYRGAFCEQSSSKPSELRVAPETCADSPCLHARTCVDTMSGFHCSCSPGWTGARCESATCSPEYCHNGGSCLTTTSGPRCQCRHTHTGARCERSLGAPPDACAARPCKHGAACTPTPAGADFACDCPPEYTGKTCETPVDCRAVGCGEGKVCVESELGFVCESSETVPVCSNSPCNNGTCKPISDTDFTCTCDPGTTGRLCDMDIDECEAKPKICKNGVCVNTPGSFDCYCTPGYTGERCELDIDECLSNPCRNNATCQNLKNNYACVCLKGFTGKDCSVDIDECASSPCAEGATCVDEVDSYSCLCPVGVTGQHCHIDIDDCLSEPCKNGGLCSDARHNYTCDCTDTGFTGPDCTQNIDECASQPCRHGALCVDRLNDYACKCAAGYTGKNCETDIGECESSPCQYEGVCLERSNQSLYRQRGERPVVVGPHPSMILPDVFYNEFSYENASGLECVCVPGVKGARCEVNVDECLSSPCGAWGKCEDGVGSYRCVCNQGFEGEHCEVDIDECERYKPCAHGVCLDRRANYQCECQGGWGGHNCSVWLTGCVGTPCHNNGTCLPWLHNEVEHRFNCTCKPGFYGPTCERITTMSLDGNSYAEVRTVRDEGYDISFRFQTTLSNGLLAIGKGQTLYFLELANGRLNLHSSLLNKWEGVFIGSDLNNSAWQKVFVTINSSHLVLAANEEQTIYPINQNEVSNSSATSFPVTYLGGAGTTHTPFSHGPVYFIGCLQDVVINGQWVLPDASNATAGPPLPLPLPPDDLSGGSSHSPLAHATMYGVSASCPRTEQCVDNPCRSGGACEDRWTSFTCNCVRPYLGKYCQYNYTAATFGHESARGGSVVTVRVREPNRKAVRAALDISMFIRTRQPTGQIFYLGSEPKYGVPEDTSVSASLKGGELLVSLRFNHTPEEYTVGGTRLDNGYLHLIQVVRNSTLVQVKLNGTEYFRKSISAAKQLDPQVLYLGGPPPSPPPPSTPASAPAASAPPLPPLSTTTPAPPPPTALPPPPLPQAYFKGVIQDVQVSNGVREMIVEFFPLSPGELALPPAFGDVSLAPGVLPGVVSDDTCAPRPCLHSAPCRVTWNDFTCECPRGYKGKTCAEVEFCQLQGCPTDSQCRNLDRGYECVANATFDGVNTSLAYQLELGEGDANIPVVNSLTITYRSKVGGTLLYAEHGGNETRAALFSIGVFREQVSLQWQLGGDTLKQQRHLRQHAPHTEWTTLHLRISHTHMRGGFGDWVKEDKPQLTAAFDGLAWQELMTRGVTYVGGTRRAAQLLHSAEPQEELFMMDKLDASDLAPWMEQGEDWNIDSTAGEFFKGCIGEVHIGDMLLPFYSKEKLFVGPTASLLAALPHYNLISGQPWNAEAGLGCVLCLERDCLHGGHCEDIASSYACSCPRGYAGDACQHDIDECQANRCANNATCVDGVASYTCICPVGWEGQLCESEVDECLSSPCLHGGTCADLVGGFSCACAPEWTGSTCAAPRRTSCAAQPCAPRRAICTDIPPEPPTGNNFTCACHPGYEGALCEFAFCEVRPCLNGGLCSTDTDPPVCTCVGGFTGARCESETDECGPGAPGERACLHAGRCVDTFNDFYCDCARTGYEGARCEVDVDECLSYPCGQGTCENLNGSYICHCDEGLCGKDCRLPDPCYALGPAGDVVTDDNGTALHGPCQNAGICHQQCSDVQAYRCECVNGWAGHNCTEQVGASEQAGSGGSGAVLIGVGAALAALCVGGGVLAFAASQARNKRATRGTYSPSSQEYCNPRAEHLHAALKPPPEERLI